MRAVLLNNYGGPETLLWKETPIPAVNNDEILINVKAAGINPLDWKLREGIIKDRMQLPFILGCDVAGIVHAVGNNVTQFKKNDEVYAMLDMSKGGGYAEFVTTKASLVALKPKTLSFEKAASVPLASLTAWQALFDEAKLHEGQKVLIQAASGGVGSFAVQIAKAHGLFVAGTASTQNVALVKNLGADLVIDYTKEDFTHLCHDYDMVLDPIGNEVQAQSLKCLKKDGYLVTLVALSCQDAATQLGVHALRTLVRPNGERLKLITDLIDNGKIKPLIATVMPGEQIQEAHKLSQSQRAKGKIVITI